MFDHFVRLMLKDLANNKMVNEKVKQKFAENNKQNNNNKHFANTTANVHGKYEINAKIC